MRIKLIRTRRRMTQEQLADAAGMHRTFVGQVERGQRGFNIASLPRLARALSVSIADLFDDRAGRGHQRP
jgi:transcriptional regulator with XRE-family HTH domain